MARLVEIKALLNEEGNRMTNIHHADHFSKKEKLKMPTNEINNKIKMNALFLL